MKIDIFAYTYGCVGDKENYYEWESNRNEK